jgi:hypothetical protein
MTAAPISTNVRARVDSLEPDPPVAGSNDGAIVVGAGARVVVGAFAESRRMTVASPPPTV